MSSSPTVLAFDLGTSGLKAAVFDVRGALLDSEVIPLDVQFVEGGGAEQHPNVWWSAMVTAAQKLWARGRVVAADVEGIGVSSQWGGTVACMPDGTPWRPALIWMDSRGAAHAQRIASGFPTIDGFGAFKAMAWLRKTGGAPSLSGKDPVGHIAWLRHHEKHTYERTATFLEPKDWVNFKLTGRAVASFDSITLHWATDNRRIDDVRYDDALLKQNELERGKLPDLVPPGSLIGSVSESASRELGVPRTARVVAGGGDMHMAAIGAGTTADFDAHLCLGTSSWLLAHVPFKKADLPHNMASLPAAIPGRYLFCNEQESAGAGLKLLVERVMGGADASTYESLLEAAAQVSAGAGGVLYLPWLHGERSPVDDRLVRGGFVGLSLKHDAAHLARAVLEGVALNARWLLVHLERNLGRPLNHVTVVGGGARSALWCQVHADVLGIAVKQVDAPQLANARGAALQALVALGRASWSDVPSLVPIQATFEPRRQHQSLYTSRFEQFLLEFKHRQAMSRRFPPPEHSAHATP